MTLDELNKKLADNGLAICVIQDPERDWNLSLCLDIRIPNMNWPVFYLAGRDSLALLHWQLFESSSFLADLNERAIASWGQSIYWTEKERNVRKFREAMRERDKDLRAVINANKFKAERRREADMLESLRSGR